MDFPNSAFDPNTVSLNPYDSDPVSVNVNAAGVIPPSEDTTNSRTTKTQIGLGDVLRHDKNTITRMFLDGQEQALRDQAASTIDSNKNADKQQAILDIASRQGPLSIEQFNELNKPVNPTDPKSVIEDNYGKQYMNKMYDAAHNIQDTFMDHAMEDIPEVVGLTKDTATRYSSNIQYAMTRAENAEDTLKAQGIVPFIADVAKPWFMPGYANYKTGAGFEFLGVGLENQARDMLKESDPIKFKERFDAIYEPLLENNPQMAVLFANSVVGLSGNQQFVTSALNVVDTLGAPAAALGTAKLINNVRRGFQSSVRASTIRNPTNATMADGFGNTGEAAVQRASQSLSAGADGTYRPTGNNAPGTSPGPSSPIEKGISSLPTGLRTDREAIVQDAAGTGSLSRELTVRLENDYLKAEQGIVDTSIGTSKVQRTGLDFATPEQIREIKENVVKGQYPSIANAILDIGNPVYDVNANVHMWPVRLGTYDAEQFMTEAQGRAAMVREGFPEANITGVDAKGFIPEAALINPLKNPLTTFQTAKGSTYTVHPDGTTIRDKAARPEHPGDSGVKERSQQTVYITEQEYNAYAKSDKRAVDTTGGKVRLFTDTDNKVFIEGKTTPKKGLMPVEILPNNKIHFGNKITDIVKGQDKSRFGEARVENGLFRYFDKDGIEYAISTKPGMNTVPVSVKEGNVKFHSTIKTPNDLANAVIEQNGLGYHAQVWLPLKEDDHLMRDLLGKLEGSKSIATTPGLSRWVNSIIGYARSSDTTLAPLETHNRKTATYAIAAYHKLLQDEMRMVEDVARGRVRINAEGKDRNPIISKLDSFGRKLTQKRVWDEFKRTLAAGQRMDNPDGSGKGYFFETPSELNGFYLENFQRMPSFTETRGYMAFRRMYEMDRVFRGLREYANKSRLGAMQHQFKLGDIPSGFFEGVSLKTFPGKEWPVAIIEKDGSVKIIRGNAAGSTYKRYVETVQNGTMQAVEVYNPELFSFNHIPELSGKFIRYVVAPTFERKNLGWDQIRRRSGGHLEFDYDTYIKQAHVQEVRSGKSVMHLYLGDKTYMPVAGRAQGTLITQYLNRAMELMPTNEAMAKMIIEDRLGIPWKDWKKEFAPSRNAETGAITPPRLKLGEPFRVVPKDASIGTMDDTLRKRYENPITRVSTFKDGAHSSSLARNYQVAFTQERDSHDLMTMKVEGTKTNPIFKYEPAQFIDPITTMNRALNRITQTTFMDDMKILSTEMFLREAAPWMKMSEAELRSSPYYAFMTTANKDAFVKDAPGVIVRNLLSNRFKTKMFLGTPSKFDSVMHETSQMLADTTFDKIGPKSQLVPFWALGKIEEPIAAIRAMAYHFKMGVWSPHQILTQSQSFVTIASVAPRSAVAGTVANLLHEWALWNRTEETLNALDKIAVHVSSIPSFGTAKGFHQWKIGEWKEAFLELQRRNFDKVGGEWSTLDTQLNKSWVRNEWGKFLDAGQMFFQGIESRVRRGAWYTAYKEARHEKPVIAFSEAEKSKILDRADDLSGNMSRASASILQSGPLGPLMQFSKYQIGLAEYFWGSRIADTASGRIAARMRMVLAYQLFFGFGGAVGLGGLPVGDYFRKVAMNNGYVVGDKWLSSMLMEGPTSAGIAWATSGDLHDISKGNWYNLNKLGATGITQLADLFNSDKTWWEMMPSTSIGYNTFKNTGGFRRDMASMWPGHDEDAVFKPKADDFADILKEVTSFGSAWQLKVALGTGKWMSKNEQYQADVSAGSALVMALTGLSLREADDNYLLGQIAKYDKEQETYAINKFKMEGQRGINALDNGDPEQYKDYFTRAFSWLKAFDVPVERYGEAVSDLAKGNEAKIETSRYNWAFGKNVPESQKATRQDAFTRFERNKQ